MHSASAGVVDVSPTDLETCVEMTYNVGYLYTNIDILNILFSPVIQHCMRDANVRYRYVIRLRTSSLNVA